MNIEIEISPEISSNNIGISLLLERCFPDTFEGREYYKQIPNYRITARDGDKLIGQAGVDYRVIRAGSDVIPVVGLVDLCVEESYRSKGIGGRIIEEVERMASDATSCDYIILYADDPSIYLRHGFTHVDNIKVKWLAIDERRTLGVVEKDMTDIFMCKPISSNIWTSDSVDMLGYLY